MNKETTPPAPSISVSEKIESTDTFQVPALTQEIINAQFNKELSLFRYQDQLNGILNYTVTIENIEKTQELMKLCRGVVKKMKDAHQKIKKPHWSVCVMCDNALNSPLETFQNAMSRIDKELQERTKKRDEENRKIKEEEDRVRAIEKDIDNTLLDYSLKIAIAKDANTLVTIEKMLGSLKGNKSRFQEFLPKFVERCGELTPLIKKQKETIKELEELERQRLEAEKANDDRALLELQEKKELAEHSFEENKIVVQEISIQQAIRPDIQIAESVPTEIKYRRQSWKWEVKDIKVLAKKAPHLVIVSADEEKIDELLKTKKADGSLKDIEELEYLGVHFYLEKLA